jgi:hypothetical protein
VLTRRIPRPSVALVVAFAALFAALGGTGYAALKITGKNIVNGTVTGADVDNKSLGGKELKPDTLDGDQIKESALGTVPDATHAASADSAISAQTAAKAADADAVGGIPAAQLMTVKTRAYEGTIAQQDDFPSGAHLRTLTDLPAGTYLVTARLTYANPGAGAQASSRSPAPTTSRPSASKAATRSWCRCTRSSARAPSGPPQCTAPATAPTTSRGSARSSPSASTDHAWRAGHGRPARPAIRWTDVRAVNRA